jgi:hypothetical protein
MNRFCLLFRSRCLLSYRFILVLLLLYYCNDVVVSSLLQRDNSPMTTRKQSSHIISLLQKQKQQKQQQQEPSYSSSDSYNARKPRYEMNNLFNTKHDNHDPQNGKITRNDSENDIIVPTTTLQLRPTTRMVHQRSRRSFVSLSSSVWGGIASSFFIHQHPNNNNKDDDINQHSFVSYALEKDEASMGSATTTTTTTNHNNNIVEMKLFIDPLQLFQVSIPARYYVVRRTAAGDLPDEKTGKGRRGSSIFTAGDLAKTEVISIERYVVRTSLIYYLFIFSSAYPIFLVASYYIFLALCSFGSPSKIISFVKHHA